ncbi:hypothetical protein [Nocardia sp. NPDC058497]|uniref:hypothetical protein n=1 Tax=Nocardia sp. NPDC058497 TaxID=3346529 RepID=UPI0036691204
MDVFGTRSRLRAAGELAGGLDEYFVDRGDVGGAGLDEQLLDGVGDRGGMVELTWLAPGNRRGCASWWARPTTAA